MRPIDADKIREKAVPHTKGAYGYNANIKKWAVLVEDIDAAPTLDPAQLVPEAEWSVKYPLRECGKCGEIYSELGGNGGKAWNFCPNCGARMREEAAK